MPTLLIKNARILVTMDEQRREIEDGVLFARDGVIVEMRACAAVVPQILPAMNCRWVRQS